MTRRMFFARLGDTLAILLYMSEKILSVFVDESGRYKLPDELSHYYIVGMALHDQGVEIGRVLQELNRDMAALGLPHH